MFFERKQVGVFYLIILYCVKKSLGLYEDQIGKFDWKKSLLGGVVYGDADLYTVDPKLFVATELNVVAALNYADGEIIWRRVLEKGSKGSIKMLEHYGNELITVSGSNIVTVRFWNTKLGFINNQYNIILPTFIKGGECMWFTHGDKLHCASILPEKRIVILNFDMKNCTKGSDDIDLYLPLSGNDIKCAQSKGIIACLGAGGEVSAVTLNGATDLISSKIQNYENGSGKLLLDGLVNCADPTFTTMSAQRRLLLHIIDGEIVTRYLPNEFSHANAISLSTFGKTELLFSVSLIETTQLKLGYVVRYNDGGEQKIQFDSHNLENTHVSSPRIVKVACDQLDSSSFSCNVLVSTADKFLALFKKQLYSRETDGKLLWKREEALAEIVAVEMIELPISEAERFIQHEFDIKDAGVIGMCFRRIYSQLLQLRNFLFYFLGFSKEEIASERSLFRDRFNFHKLIIIATKVGKIFVIDNISKEVLWSYYSEKAFAFLQSSEPNALIFIQRTVKHFPLPPVCTVILESKENGNGVIVQLNPLEFSSDKWMYLPYRVLQAMLLPVQSDQYLSPIIIIDQTYSTHVFPASEASTASQLRRTLYFYIAYRDIGRIIGLGFNTGTHMNGTLSQLWNMETHGTILHVASKNPIEKVHSQGRVLADRSVLYKYVNPNLLAVVTQQSNNEGKSVLNFFLIDGITGFIVHSDVHNRATQPIHLVHSENWVVLFYFNEKVRRNEAASYELFEGVTQNNSTVFSSVESDVFRPVVDRNAYILPVSHINAVKETVTEKGITSKHIILGLGTGSVVEVPWMFLDPRRPSTVTAEMREEGIIPYTPEIPIVMESHINYNQTLYHIKGIYTAPASLESTCLVFVYGLDLFYTRVAPSKTFDLLKDDFDYILIVIVLICLAIATFITKHLAYQKALYQTWR